MLLPETGLEFMAIDSGSCSSDWNILPHDKSWHYEEKSYFGLAFFFSLSISFLPSWAFLIRQALFKEEQKTRFLENMWWYNPGILYKEAGEDLTEVSTIQELDIFYKLNMGRYQENVSKKIVSDVHIWTLWSVNTPEKP